ncbi:hypothetical protein AQUCO_00900201v1 [Aquilegia coerulea]|uniref:Uncharacterized protein n=1 Tax=Aquilegia coerulea TaxID=218851 RepID=A0A2G5ECK2_AQUCA|nr:hypothetical protein AQUCO_00900201v1 [Aquilegia coerulea]
MKVNSLLTAKILKFDEGALKFLKDIEGHMESNGICFKLEFSLDPNPYFKNSVLTKTYRKCGDDEDFLEPIG